MSKNIYPSVVTIAGTDPSGGAGIQADIKAISANGCYAASVITALVAQNTQGVIAIQEVSPDFVKEQIDAVFNDLTISAVKIGMLQNVGVMEVVSSALTSLGQKNIVIDPVMIAKSGHSLLNVDALHFLKSNLFPHAFLITPNLPEAENITGKRISIHLDMEMAARQMGIDYRVNVLLKGGHLLNDQSSDVLYCLAEDSIVWFHAKRIQTKNTHGTGCTLSAAIAANLASGCVLVEAVTKAKQYLSNAIIAGSQLKVGKGNGPVHHFYFM